MLGFPVQVLSGEGGVTARRVFALGALGVSLAVWAAVFLGLFGSEPATLVTGLQLLSAATGAVCLVAAAGRPRPPLGTGSTSIAVGALVWFAASVGATISGQGTIGTRDGVEYLFVAATAIIGLGCWSAVRERPAPTAVPPTATRRLGLLDGVLVASSFAAWWLATVWGPLHDGGRTALALTSTLVDGAALAGAVLLWTRTGKSHRPNRAYVLMALVLITIVDVVQARSAIDDGSALVAFAWFLVGVLFVAASFEPRWASVLVRHEVSEIARWTQALLAPTVAVTLIGLVAVDHSPPSDGWAHVVVDGSLWFVIVTLLVRQALMLVEHIVLYRRVRASTAVLQRMADHDPLTGLLDRQAFVDVVDDVLAERTADREHGAFVWVHVDGVRRINDLLGTRVGDRVLTQIAARLRAACRDDDRLTRFAGDEFVLLRPVAGNDSVEWASRVQDELDDVFDVDGVRIRITTAIGVLDFAAGHRDGVSLLSDAAAAMVDVRTQGRNRVTVCTLDGDGEDHDGRALARDLRRALDGQRLRVHYQPMFDIATGHVLGAEALLRFEHPVRGDVPPDEFLPVAEATGLMPELAMLVLDEACTAFADDPGLGTVSVNLSDSDLADPRLLERVASTLERTGLEPHRLVIELSERVNPEPDVIRGVERLRELGVALALDDFGSSWTSLAQVQQLSVRVVKIDRQLVEIAAGPADAAERVKGLLSLLVSLAELLDVVVLAEGIETERQRSVCEELGVALGQGFLWAPALPLTAFVRFVATAEPTVLDPRVRNPLSR